ncbi:MAG TPA: DUF3883 domain-containing protein [Chthoniobacterales bacterium]|jgi:hypothetical protein|nr:DUF3883 domain-containing protein [Chthoniobacterales bacterium]
MKGYSSSRTRVFDKLDAKNIVGLLHVLSTSRLSNKTLIATRYRERWRHFEETLRFMQSVGWVREYRGDLILSVPAGVSQNEKNRTENLGRPLFEAILQSDTDYRTSLCQYLNQFRVHGAKVLHSPTVERRARESAVRNFLAGTRLISYRRRDNDYIFNHEAIDLWIWAKSLSGPSTTTQLHSAIERRERLGLDAELAAMKYEKDRLGNDWAAHIQHMAREHPLANYDIKSVTICDGEAVPRFVEVKAVSLDSYRFFWSAPEVSAARLLGTAYFLYLVPVNRDGNFDMRRLRIVENAYESVCNDPAQWEIENNILLCQPKRLAAQRTQNSEN